MAVPSNYPTFAFIGCGQVGSRHLQALALLQEPVNITVVDSAESALTRAMERFGEVGGDVERLELLTELPSNRHYDLAIFASNADIRFSLLKGLAACNSVKNILFEKVLFQKVEDLREAQSILELNGISAWVNCPRRFIEGYRQIKHCIDTGMPITVEVRGTDFGLASNAIHFIDLFAFLVGTEWFESWQYDFEESVRPARRAGCFEVFGKISINHGPHKFVMECVHQDDIERIEVCIANEVKVFRINEIEERIHFTDKVSGEERHEIFHIPLQSQVTQHHAKSIVTSGQCLLPTFRQSGVLHERILSMFQTFLAAQGVDTSHGCPIT
ncbi:hypothetical protein GCM10009092_33930 [Bowmanella denitrificans]|uniref:Gfo/Idh/MocA-like oxidoreductase N-terminal domain-containing protein n=1 Tax=Bowmanella denitrificans TaxID=366582 RepID=A0ABN0XKY9_9ALTE